MSQASAVSIKRRSIRIIKEAEPLHANTPHRTEANPGVLEQIKKAFKRGNRLAAYVGFLFGGFVPMASYILAHREISASEPLWNQVQSYLVIGGLLYSAKTLFDWSKSIFASGVKAIGFVMILEGTLIFSTTQALNFAALLFLISVNGMSSSCNLVNRK